MERKRKRGGRDQKMVPCAACNHLRRRCEIDCVLAPYFPQEASADFLMLHRVFGTSNVVKLLKNLSPPARQHAVYSLIQEAKVHLTDSIKGCRGYIQELKLWVCHVNKEIAVLESQIAQLTNSHAVNFHEMVNPSHPQMLDQNMRSQQVDDNNGFESGTDPASVLPLAPHQIAGVRYSGAETAAGPATVFPLAAQQSAY